MNTNNGANPATNVLGGTPLVFSNSGESLGHKERPLPQFPKAYVKSDRPPYRILVALGLFIVSKSFLTKCQKNEWVKQQKVIVLHTWSLEVQI